MKLRNKVILIVVIYVIVLIASFVFLTYAHEEVHRAIYESYGIESNISILNGGTTYPEENCQNDFCTLAHNLNEVFGYQLIPFMFFIWWLSLVLNLTIVISSHNKQETLNNLLDVLASK